MKIRKYEDPFYHVCLEDDVLTEICRKLYQHADSESLKKSSFYIGDQLQNNAGINIAIEETDKQHILSLLEKCREIFFRELPLGDTGHWLFGISETYMGEDLMELFPHTDNPVELISEGVPPNSVGYLKFLIYLADDNLEYPDYGTKLYSKVGDSGDHTKDFVCAKEIKFENGHLFMWKPGIDTFHGTEFISTTEHRRFFICGEYMYE